MKLNRRTLAIAIAFLMIVPTLTWWAMVEAGYIKRPGQPLKEHFNLSDRIVTIEVVENPDGQLVARFEGWEEGDPLLTGDEFFRELYEQNRQIPWLYRWLDITSATGFAWIVFGFLAQVIFAGRMIVQWWASEKEKRSVVPPVFWWMSLVGSTMLMIYFIWRQEIVGFLGQVSGWFIYVRNLWFIYGKKPESLPD